LKLEPANAQSLIAKADCYRSLNQHPEAIKIYTEILEKGWDAEVMLKRAIGHIECGTPDQALSDLNKLIHRNPTNSEAYLFKGLAYAKMKNFNEAILAFEQAIKFNSSKKATTKALYEVSKLKIELGDYYGASYTLERASSLEVDVKIIEKLRIFTEGATSIMKKKYKRGI
jgi:tetratricopeptide (TPR) repeat protein